MRIHPMATICAAAMAAVALAAAPAASADPEDRFLQINGFQADEATGQALIDVGYPVRAGLDSGESAAVIITDGVASTGWTGTQMEMFVGAAVSAFRPEHIERAIAEAATLEG